MKNKFKTGVEMKKYGAEYRDPFDRETRMIRKIHSSITYKKDNTKVFVSEDDELMELRGL